MEPTRPALPGHHPTPNIPLSGNITLSGPDEGPLLVSDEEGSLVRAAKLVARAAVEAFAIQSRGEGRELEPHVTSDSDSVGFIFRQVDCSLPWYAANVCIQAGRSQCRHRWLYVVQNVKTVRSGPALGVGFAQARPSKHGHLGTRCTGGEHSR